MTTITITLPDGFAERLATLAARCRTSAAELAEAFVVRGIEDQDAGTEGWDPMFSPEDIEAIKEGFADIEAGRVRPWTDVQEELRRLVNK